jgi:competence protein ComEA
MKRLAAALFALFALAFAAGAAEVNTASEAQLDGVKGLGPSSTRAILAERANGAFRDWADFIARVKGMDRARAAKLSAAGLTVAGQPLAAP